MPAVARNRSESRTARNDPASRATDATSIWDKTANTDPERKYVLAYKYGAETGVEGYLALGYEIETYRPGGPRLKGGRVGRDGEEIEMRGHVLMSIKREQYDEIVQNGADGHTGQKHFNELEEQLIKRRGGVDHLRGISGLLGRSGDPVLSVTNLTSAPIPDADLT